jgi:hypothetical protein
VARFGARFDAEADQRSDRERNPLVGCQLALDGRSVFHEVPDKVEEETKESGISRRDEEYGDLGRFNLGATLHGKAFYLGDLRECLAHHSADLQNGHHRGVTHATTHSGRRSSGHWEGVPDGQR